MNLNVHKTQSPQRNVKDRRSGDEFVKTSQYENREGQRYGKKMSGKNVSDKWLTIRVTTGTLFITIHFFCDILKGTVFTESKYSYH